MEIPVLNRISDLEALHQSPSNFLISQSSLSISGIARFSHAYTFWKWGAFLLLALLASFSGLLNLFVLSFRRLRPLPSQALFHYQSDADTDSDDDEEEDQETDDESESESETEEDDFRVRGSGKLGLRHRRSIGDLFSWADLAPGKSVVKLWDNLGLGLDFQDDGNVFSLRDGNREQEINYFLDAPAVVAAAGGNGEVKVWDRRVSCRIPAMIAEWHSQSKKMVSFNASGFEKLFVDMRKPNQPLRSATDSEVEAWWDADADAVMATDEDLSLARCCDAVRSHFLLGRDRNL